MKNKRLIGDARLTRKSSANKVSKSSVELRLYVSGRTSKSLHAISNLRAICREHLHNRYRIEVIDLSENPSLAMDYQIIVTPTLIRTLPVSMRKIVGDLSDTERVLVGLEIQTVDGNQPTIPA